MVDMSEKKISHRQAKDILESMVKLEHEFKHLFNGVVHGGSISNMCSQIQEMVDEQQKKAVWVPLPSV